jgi:hypothetical protein
MTIRFTKDKVRLSHAECKLKYVRQRTEGGPRGIKGRQKPSRYDRTLFLLASDANLDPRHIALEEGGKRLTVSIAHLYVIGFFVL